MYEIDVHYYMVYALAQCQGFRESEAWFLATASQFVDDHGATSPITLDIAIQETFHFAVSTKGGTEKVVRGSGPARLLFEQATGAKYADLMICKTLIMAGIGLHKLADSYAHEGFIAGIGHAMESVLGFSPDDPEARPNRAVAMAKDVYDSLGRLRQALWNAGKTKARMKFSWDDIKADVRTNFSVEKRKPGGSTLRMRQTGLQNTDPGDKMVLDDITFLQEGVPIADQAARVAQWKAFAVKKFGSVANYDQRLATCVLNNFVEVADRLRKDGF